MGSLPSLKGLMLLVVMASSGCVHHTRAHGGGDLPAVMVETILDQSALRDRLARFAPVVLSFDIDALDEREKAALPHLLRAADVMDELFWEQSSGSGLALRGQLEQRAQSAFGKMVLHYLMINYGPLDRRHGFEPFLRVPEKLRGAGFYPENMSREELLSWIQAHPADEARFRNRFSVIRRKGGGLVSVPYHQAYRSWLQTAGAHLRKAAGSWSHGGLKKVLIAREGALLSDRYTEGEEEEIGSSGSLLEVLIGPRDRGEDRLLHTKAAFESRIFARDEQEMERLSQLEPLIGEMMADLPLSDPDRIAQQSQSVPIVVADLVYASGAARAKAEPPAFDLQDAALQSARTKGRVVLKNLSQAVFDEILIPISRKVVIRDQARELSFAATFLQDLMHEVAHGIGPRGSFSGDEALWATIEEAKAEVLGAYALLFLGERQVVPEKSFGQALTGFLPRVFQAVRASAQSVEAGAVRLVFNCLRERGVYRYDEEQRAYALDVDRAPREVRALLGELMQILARGDLPGAGDLLDRRGAMDEHALSLLPGLREIPVELEWIFSVRERIAKEPEPG